MRNPRLALLLVTLSLLSRGGEGGGGDRRSGGGRGEGGSGGRHTKEEAHVVPSGRVISTSLATGR